MNLNMLLNRTLSTRKMNQLQNSTHIVDQLLLKDRISQQQYNAFIVYEQLRHLLWRHRDIKTKFLTYCQSWGRLSGHTIDTFENEDLERFWLWIERHLKGRQFIHFLDHVVETGKTNNVSALSTTLNKLYLLWKDYNLNTLLRAA